MTEYDLFNVPVAVLVLILVQAAREAGMPTRLSPILSIFLGIAAGLAVSYESGHFDPVKGVSLGIGIGAGASGLFSGVATFSRNGTADAPAPVEPPTLLTPTSPAP